MIPVMFYLTRGNSERAEFLEIDNDIVTKDSDEIWSAIPEFRRQGCETRSVFIPKKVSDV
jgi:hypothetical protein